MDPLQQALQQGTPKELAQLELALSARAQGGVVVVGGVPFIHGVPALAGSATSLSCFSSWSCPHCRSHLSSEGFICLNGCHLTQPAYQRMQAGLSESQAVVDRGTRLLGMLVNRRAHTEGGPFAVDTFPQDFNQYRSLIRVDIADQHIQGSLGPIAHWMRSQPLKGFHGIGGSIKGSPGNPSDKLRNVYFGLFCHPDDATLFKLTFGGDQG